MKRILYVSAAARGVGDADIASILAASRRNNADADITGMLLHLDGGFLQILEGPDDAVDETFARIGADARHTQIILLWSEPIAARGFPDWSMGFDRLDRHDPRWRGAFRIDPRGAPPPADVGPDIIALMQSFYETSGLARFA